MTTPTTSFTAARTDTGNTFTGVSTGTSWNLTTPTITTSLTFGNGQGFLDIAADITGLSRGTNAQKMQIYETRDAGLSNYSRLSISAPSGGPITFASEAAGTGTARAFSFAGGVIGLPAGSSSLPAIYSTADEPSNTTGLYFASSSVRVMAADTAAYVMGFSQFSMVRDVPLGWGGQFDASATNDTIIRRGGAAATVQFGSDFNGAAPAQTLQAANAITGTNLAGGNLTLRPGAGTGTGTISALIFQSPTLGSTGTTAQTQTTRASMSEAGVKCFSPLWLSNAAVTGLVAGAVAALTTATIVIYDSTGQAYRVPCVI